MEYLVDIYRSIFSSILKFQYIYENYSVDYSLR